MTQLRSVPSDFDNVFKLPPYGVLVPPRQPAAGRVQGQLASTVFSAARGLTVTVLRSWRQMVEARHARHHLMELDDHLLRDIGLTRADVYFGDFETLDRRRRAGGIR